MEAKQTSIDFFNISIAYSCYLAPEVDFHVTWQTWGLHCVGSSTTCELTGMTKILIFKSFATGYKEDLTINPRYYSQFNSVFNA